jgi:hypothetical protein
MSATTIEQGKSWVLDVFEHVREQYRDTVPVAHILPWHDGQTSEASWAPPGAQGAVTHALTFEVGPETYDIPFTEHELTAGADPDNSAARLAIKKKILETFTALESQAHDC